MFDILFWSLELILSIYITKYMNTGTITSLLNFPLKQIENETK